MNRYCSEEYCLEAVANARADIYLKKNMVAHLKELSEGIVELSNLIKKERRKNNVVVSRQKILIELLQFSNEIKFNIKTIDDGTIPDENPTAMITDLEYSNFDLQNNENLAFHIATLTYDIDNIEDSMLHLPDSLNQVKQSLTKLIDGLNQCKDALQSVDNYLNGINAI